MRTAISASHLRKSLFCIALIYSLILSLFMPFTISKTAASSPPADSGNKPRSVSQTVKKKGGWRDGEVLVRFRDSASFEDRHALIKSLGAKNALGLIGPSSAYKIPLKTGQDPKAVASQLRLNRAVEIAEPNYLISADQISSSDPHAYAQWALKGTTTGSEQPNFIGISNSSGRQQTTAQSSTVIAVIDSGIDFSHPDLRNNRWVNTKESGNSEDDDRNNYPDDLYGWDWVAKSNNVKDTLGHGTKVAGIIASQGNNAAAIPGITWNVSLMSLRVLDATGTGDVASAIEAIDYAVAKGAKVINCSWGTDENSIFLREALERAGKGNVLVVSSAGNESRDIEQSPYYPASYGLSNLLAVAATDNSDNLLKSSNTGATHVQIAAPGGNVLSTSLNGSYEAVVGTSASAALVSAFAGLVKALRPGLSAERTLEMIIAGGRSVPELKGKVSSGKIIDVAGAITQINTLPPNEGRDSVDTNTDIPEGTSNNPGNSMGTVPLTDNGNSVKEPARTKGAPGTNLPNLDLMRNQNPVDPKAPPPIPSTRCPLQLPDCNKKKVSQIGSKIELNSAPQDNNALVEDEDRGTQEGPVEFIASNSTPELMAHLFVETRRIISDSFPSLGLSLKANNQLSSSMMPVPLPPADNYAIERLLPASRTGGAGVDMLSRNYNWSLPLVSLRGRAGLDLGLSLSYNSLVWTKSGSTIAFDADHGFPSPGFRLGFPIIQQRFYNSQTGKHAYLLITPSGSRVELRQVDTSNVYEAADSSYLQLIDNTTSLLVRTKDGTQLYYLPDSVGTDYHCTQIKDRNGNYISATYSSMGRILSVTDTLNRLITFNYDTNQNLLSITQSWKRDSASGLVTETHTWATFGWDNLTIQTSFSGLALSGVSNGQIIPVLKQVGLSDGSYYRFDYTSWGQVSAIKNYEVTNSLFASVTYNLDTWAGQTDCPRFTERRDYVRDWNNNAEAITTFSAYNPVSGVADMIMPDGTLYREYFSNSGWSNGITYLSEVWSGGVKKKWTTVAWTQEDTSQPYQLNPRPTDISIYDEAGNRRRTDILYHSSYGLPWNVREYAPDGATIIRQTYTDFHLSQAYINRHIIGLLSAVHVVGVNGYESKITYEYDWGGDYWQALPAAAIQHDGGTDYTGRGNLCSVVRWDVNDINNASNIIRSYIRYNRTGSVIRQEDHYSHGVSFSYSDSFSDAVSRNTFAYPTTITDADNYSSTIQYNYSMGVVSRTQDPKGAVQTFAFDAAGRPERTTNQNNGAYQRWVYTNSTLVQQFTTIQSGAPEAYTFTTYDAAGRMTASGSDHPNSTGGYATTLYRYNVMGRLSQQSNPTEMTTYWIPSGDDAAGWVWSYQQYDWQGRPTITTNTDGTTRQASYSGCGCAGGEVTTLTGEAVTQGNRRQKIYKDVLGRAIKMETLNWDGSIYSTVVNSYNARNQVTNVRQYAGAEGGGTYQDTVMTYDGFGRLATRKAPSQTNPTTYTYNKDNTIYRIMDGRQAKQTFGYNNRHLVTSITYDAPLGSGITIPGSVSYTYDAAGNRTMMTDGSGGVTYQYNDLSQMTQESRWFTGGSGSFNISYSYNLAGQLASITDPFNSTISYSYDQLGRISSVTGTSFGGVTQYASNMQYRAWGALKHVDYGNTRLMNISYNARLQPISLFITGVMSKAYQYNSDGSLHYSQDNLDSRFDRSYTYDHVGRITAALSGPAARQQADTTDRPYYQTSTYDAFGHLTQLLGNVWNGMGAGSFGPDSYTNDKNPSWAYDVDGRVTNDSTAQYTFDAAGRIINVDGDEESGNNSDQQVFYDGDGQRAKLVNQKTIDLGGGPVTYTTTRYELRSSLTGGVITEVDENGQKVRSFVYGNGGVLAVQTKSGTTESIAWQHTDASGASYRETNTSGAVVSTKSAEADPLSRDAGTYSPYNSTPPQRLVEYKTYPGFSEATGPNCIWDGLETPCASLQNLANAGALKIRADYTVYDRHHTEWEELESVGLGLLRRRHFRGIELHTRTWPEIIETRRARTEITGRSVYDYSFFSLNAYGEQVTQTEPRWVPLKNLDELKKLTQDRLNYGNCKGAVAKLIEQLSWNGSKRGNIAIVTDVMEMFRQVEQSPSLYGEGGFRINVPPSEYPPDERVPGGSGYSRKTPVKWGDGTVIRLNGEPIAWVPTTWIYIRADRYTNQPPKGNIPYEYGITAIHEMLHLMGKYQYSEPDLNKAAGDLGAGSIEDYLRNNCSPPNMR